MELHRLDGVDATGLDQMDIGNITGYDSNQKTMGMPEQPEIAYEILDDNGNVVMYADIDENIYVIDGLGGFFKKIGKGLKKFAKKVVKPVVKTFNRFVNPATILLRNGFLLAMKINMMKVAERLRFGYLSTSEIRKRGGDLRRFAKLQKAVRKAEKIYELAGGKKKNLKRAILKGKGNRDRQVPLSGFALGNPFEADDTTFNDPFEKFIIESDSDTVEAFLNNELQVEGLGAVASGAAITAASGAVAGVAAILAKIGNLFGKAKDVKDQATSIFTRPKGSELPDIRFQTPPFQNELPDTTSNPTNPTFFKKHKTTLLVGAGLLVVGTGVAVAMRSKPKKKRKPLSGTPKRRHSKKRDTLGRFTKGSKTTKKRTVKRKSPKQLVPKVLL